MEREGSSVFFPDWVLLFPSPCSISSWATVHPTSPCQFRQLYRLVPTTEPLQELFWDELLNGSEATCTFMHKWARAWVWLEKWKWHSFMKVGLTTDSHYYTTYLFKQRTLWATYRVNGVYSGVNTFIFLLHKAANSVIWYTQFGNLLIPAVLTVFPWRETELLIGFKYVSDWCVCVCVRPVMECRRCIPTSRPPQGKTPSRPFFPQI